MAAFVAEGSTSHGPRCLSNSIFLQILERSILMKFLFALNMLNTISLYREYRNLKSFFFNCVNIMFVLLGGFCFLGSSEKLEKFKLLTVIETLL